VARVLVTRPLTEGGTDPLLEAGHEIVAPDDGVALSSSDLAKFAAECDGIVCHLTDHIDLAVLQAGSSGRLRVVANAAVGYDNIDVVRANSMGITVCNTPGVLDDTTADLTFLLILAATRLTTDAERDLREGRWKGWGFGSHLA
jgi:lactate dehydrogenase-like 2-hydroxyacid dehydrogenase